MIFYLSIFLVGLAMLILYSYFSPGQDIFVAGMLIMWWGMLQVRDDLSRH